MTDDYMPQTESSGALVPPPRVPPTALAVPAPLAPRDPLPRSPARNVLRTLLHSALDALDSAGDTIASALGVR